MRHNADAYENPSGGVSPLYPDSRAPSCKRSQFSSLFATIPLLFFLTLAGSFFLTPEVRQILESQLFVGLSPEYRQSIMSGLERFADRPGSLSIVTIAVFLFSVHNLCFDAHRVVRAGLGLGISPARGRARAVALNGVFLLIIYATALLTLAAQVGSTFIPVPEAIVEFAARLSAIVILAGTLWSVVRLAGGQKIPFRLGAPVFLAAAVIWQIAVFLSGSIVLRAGRRVVIYGVLATAILFLFLMRVFAEILLHSTLWIYELRNAADRVKPDGIGTSSVDSAAHPDQN
ncbi:MAG: YihY/virulence factor BrkB family protein [Spirochaeta sp.]|nr:YihY/virulence factor BrkB family protein [Spirochaeta sp.]